MSTTVIGAIADDVTGATDVAVAFRREGLRTLLYFGTPDSSAPLPPHDALVVALKSRMTPARQAVADSLDAVRWLRDAGAERIYFKYCSTFDSTPAGNIGPVLDAVSAELHAAVVVQTPSSPEHGRTQYRGYLFVNGALLSESPMRDHPVTPMTDSSLVRLLTAQTTTPVSLIDLDVVRNGSRGVRAAVDAVTGDDVRYVLVDATSEDDLQTIGEAIADLPFVADAAGLAGGVARAVAAARPGDGSRAHLDELELASRRGRVAVLAGSCSARTLEQVQVLRDLGRPLFRLDPLEDADPETLAADALAWFDSLPPGTAPLIYSSCSPEELGRIQSVLGVAESARILETATGLVARGLLERGVTRLVSAGGETSGAVIAALAVEGVVIGDEAARGVPWIYTTGPEPVALLLKSGNFGDVELLARASTAVAEVAR